VYKIHELYFDVWCERQIMVSNGRTFWFPEKKHKYFSDEQERLLLKPFFWQISLTKLKLQKR